MSAVGNALIEQGETIMRERGHELRDDAAWDALMDEIMSAPAPELHAAPPTRRGTVSCESW